MAAPLNLTLKRGPSVWDNPPTPASNWRIYGIAAGAALGAFAARPRANRHWLMGLALGVVGTSLLAGRFRSAIEEGGRQVRVLRGVQKDHVVDRASEDSFPASDAPQYQ